MFRKFTVLLLAVIVILAASAPALSKPAEFPGNKGGRETPAPASDENSTVEEGENGEDDRKVGGDEGSAASNVPGPPNYVRKKLQQRFGEMKNGNDAVEGEEGEDDSQAKPPGPPAFVREMLHERFKVIENEKIIIRGRPFQSDLPPVIKNGRTLIPVRAVMYALGAEVEWDAALQKVTITRGNVVVELFVIERVFYVNGEPFELDVPVQLLGNRTFVPLRFIAEALGENVYYDENTSDIIIGDPDNGTDDAGGDNGEDSDDDNGEDGDDEDEGGQE
ncbi:MAG: stalk domain-containing protein [Bacillota bacterium]